MTEELVKKVLYTAAHGGFFLERVPLGGGGAVCEQLVKEWRQTSPFPFELITPAILGGEAPQGKDLVRLSEWAYARFCRAFGNAVTRAILTRDPSKTIVLCNDVSEGPDFRLLAERGYPLYTIYHVDVVDYFTRIYMKQILRPEATTHFYRWLSSTPLRALVPGVAELIFKKQQDSVMNSRGLIVPSNEMRDVLVRCYPVYQDKIHVLPWGIWDEPLAPVALENEINHLRSAYPVPPGSATLLMLSRISPEKGQDRVLKALTLWEKQDDFPAAGVVLFIAGEAAYMLGSRFMKKLTRLAGELHRTRVIFIGYASGARKQALFRLADLYLFTSRHESYGLTLMEAMRAGCPVLATSSHGARDVFQPGVGEMLPPAPEEDIPGLLRDGLRRLLSDRNRLTSMGEAARRYASAQKFSDTAARLAKLLQEA
ncbi:MAG: glycosyltransferase family 4 protein [Elusimicrobiota bacterium]|jgi:glycosyltransferase involved in cell wall biosynthesis